MSSFEKGLLFSVVAVESCVCRFPRLHRSKSVNSPDSTCLKGTKVPAIHRAGCACGSVRYSLKGEPFRIGICHCTDCRKESGSVFVVDGQ